MCLKENEVAQSCPTLCDPMDCSLSGFSVHGIFQERVLEWITISFSRGSSRPRNWTWVSCIAGRRFTVWATIVYWLIVVVWSPSRVWLSVTPWTVACQAPLSMRFSRQEYWSSFLFPTPGDLPKPGSEPVSPALAGRFFITEPPGSLTILQGCFYMR